MQTLLVMTHGEESLSRSDHAVAATEQAFARLCECIIAHRSDPSRYPVTLVQGPRLQSSFDSLGESELAEAVQFSSGLALRCGIHQVLGHAHIQVTMHALTFSIPARAGERLQDRRFSGAASPSTQIEANATDRTSVG